MPLTLLSGQVCTKELYTGLTKVTQTMWEQCLWQTTGGFGYSIIESVPLALLSGLEHCTITLNTGF